MAKGDHLSVNTSYLFIDHHGIDMGDETVVHFSKKEKFTMPIVERTPKRIFAGGDEKNIITISHRSFLPPDTVVAIAERLLTLQKAGLLKQYDLWKFNCEHLANLCKTGDFRSWQVEVAEHRIERTNYFGELAATIGVALLGI
jgi:hypothetical protein